METKIKEGSVVRSHKFVQGYRNTYFDRVNVGDYKELDYKIYSVEDVDFRINEKREGKKYVIISAWESQPHSSSGGRYTSYENRFVAKELDANNKWLDGGEEIHFSTCYAYRGAIDEEDIEIVKQMQKIFV